MCESCVGAAQSSHAFCLWVWPWSIMALFVVYCVLFVVCCLGYPVWMPSCFVCGWFKWLRAIRAVEILSPVFSLGYHVGDAQLVFLLVLDRMV